MSDRVAAVTGSFTMERLLCTTLQGIARRWRAFASRAPAWRHARLSRPLQGSCHSSPFCVSLPPRRRGLRALRANLQWPQAQGGACDAIRRNAAKADRAGNSQRNTPCIETLVRLEEFFDAGERWHRGELCDGHGRYCLIGAVDHLRCPDAALRYRCKWPERGTDIVHLATRCSL